MTAKTFIIEVVDASARVHRVTFERKRKGMFPTATLIERELTRGTGKFVKHNVALHGELGSLVKMEIEAARHEVANR